MSENVRKFLELTKPTSGLMYEEALWEFQYFKTFEMVYYMLLT